MDKMLYWRVVNDPGFAARVVDYISRGVVSHVEFIVENGTQTIGARADGGVRYRPINYKTFDLDLRFQAPCTDAQYAAGMTFLTAQLGKPYDFVDIAAIGLNRNWHDPNAWICSELWAATLEQAGMLGPLDSNINLFTPQDSLIVSSAMWPARK
jgi:uncharacterized protein YycO